MNNKTIAGLLAIVLLASGCGGGGGGGDDTPTSTPQPAPPPVVATPKTGAAAIAAPEGFSFLSQADFRVQVDLVGSVPSRTYLTVCQVSEDGAAQFDRCLLKASVESGEFDDVLQLPNNIDELEVALWSFSPARVISQGRWVRGTGADNVVRLSD